MSVAVVWQRRPARSSKAVGFFGGQLLRIPAVRFDPAHDQPRPRRPGGQVAQAGQLGRLDQRNAPAPPTRPGTLRECGSLGPGEPGTIGDLP
ncbi:hypothetical protein [Streptomyces sp. ME18-1-4]|uniref:hypothetical protein n=1 Tax=Streptomyces sp. ME18-1-4 TaxID=3028685 RepID=UPI0029AFC755|nr:hypothetical protein [Streptomyces sp. ME18-1-4]MDX3243937.1 hypothetical protein [Streptomyces sp. ME18-1-4]